MLSFLLVDIKAHFMWSLLRFHLHENDQFQNPLDPPQLRQAFMADDPETVRSFEMYPTITAGRTVEKSMVSLHNAMCYDGAGP